MSGRSLVIVGHGKMGRAIEELARQGGWEVAGILDEGWRGDPAAPKDVFGRASVAVEFTEPGSTVENIRAIVQAGCPVVVGTTGWYDQLEQVSSFVRSVGGTMLWSPNFSMGAQILMALAGAAGALVKQAGVFDAHIVETHHAAKKDKPSGTAASLARATESTLGRPVPVTSVRTGHVPGTHELVFDAPFEQIRVEHHARDRRVFAAGALVAADWLRTHRSSGAVFTMQDILKSSQEVRGGGGAT